MRTWDTKAIFEAAGGASALRAALLANCGSAPELPTMYMWTQRDRIAADWVPECIAVVMLKFPYLTVWDLMRGPSPAPRPMLYTGELDVDLT